MRRTHRYTVATLSAVPLTGVDNNDDAPRRGADAIADALALLSLLNNLLSLLTNPIVNLFFWPKQEVRPMAALLPTQSNLILNYEKMPLKADCRASIYRSL